jgi:hypothetical protein
MGLYARGCIIEFFLTCSIVRCPAYERILNLRTGILIFRLFAFVMFSGYSNIGKNLSAHAWAYHSVFK